MKKRFTANFVGITYIVTIRKNYKTGGFCDEKKAYHFNGYVNHPQFEKIARNIVAAQVKKDMSIYYSHLRGYSIISITDI